MKEWDILFRVKEELELGKESLEFKGDWTGGESHRYQS